MGENFTNSYKVLDSQPTKTTCPGHATPYAKRLAYSVSLSFPPGYDGVWLGGPQRWLAREAAKLGKQAGQLQGELIREWEAISPHRWLLPFAACELSKLKEEAELGIKQQ